MPYYLFSISRMWTYGHEIGIGVSVPNTASVERFAQNIKDMEINIKEEAKLDYIYGTRYLNLINVPKYFEAVYELEIEYDSTLQIYNDVNDGKWLPFPFIMYNDTIDRPLKCTGENGCPVQPYNYTELWQLPVFGLNENNTLLDNFNDHFDGQQRAPFALNFNLKDLKDDLIVDGLNDFLDQIQSMDDVWILTMNQMLTWVREPVKIGLLYRYGEWKCEAREKDDCLVRGLDPVEDVVNKTDGRGNTLEALNINNLFPAGYYIVYWQTGLLIGGFIIIRLVDKYKV